MHTVRVIIPARNEEKGLRGVLRDIVREAEKAGVQEVIVVDNGSHDNTHAVALAHGATALREEKKGYGRACLRALRYMAAQRYDSQDIVVFMDADRADDTRDIHHIIAPIIAGRCGLVIGSRHLGRQSSRVEARAMGFAQRWGNRLAVWLINRCHGTTYTDLGPFRAIRYADLLSLHMADKNYGWTIEMQLKAAINRMAHCEVAVGYRRRVGTSKISGTWRGVWLAGTKILYTFLKYTIRSRLGPHRSTP